MSGQEGNSNKLFEPLTRRERDILALLAQGHSGPEIAEELTLAVSSVKWHTQHLYGKLGVNSKKQAVARARELGLLGSPLATTTSALLDVPVPGPVEPLPNTAPERKHNLPLQVTRFFGREREVAQLIERLGENRLVTLTGSGGVGKTRLSLRTAEALLPEFADGVWLVELAPLSDPALVGQQVATSLGLRDQAGRPILETLTFYLHERQVLLVLDNCEHLLGTCGQLADRLLRACSRLRILASSREPLGIAGEAVFSVPSLSFPDPGHLPPLDQMTDYVAVSLFLDRARLALPDYAVTADNATALARICQRLDGIPLALEMAASRLRLLNTETLAARLDDAFRLLTGGSRSALPRQQTLRAMIDWSYNLLGPEERRLFQRLSVFAGGFTFEAAEAVCTGDDLPTGQMLEWLAALVEKSLVEAGQVDQERRYRLLEVMRQYAREKLTDAGESERWHTRHRDYFYAYLEANVPKLDTKDRPAWTRRLKSEQDNVRQALEWSFSDASAIEAGPKLVLALPGTFTGIWSSYQEYADWHLRALAWCEGHDDLSPGLYAKLLGEVARPMSLNDPPAGLRLAARAVDVSRSLGPAGRETLMWNLLSLGRLYLQQRADPTPAAAPLAEAEAIFLALGPDGFSPETHLFLVAAWPGFKAELANSQGRHEDAKMHADEGLRRLEAAGLRFEAVAVRWEAGEACLNVGQYDQARDHFLAALDLSEEYGDTFKAHTLRWLAFLDWRQGQLDRGLDYGRASLREAEKISDPNVIASDLGVCASIAAGQGQSARAARLSGAAQALYARQHRHAWEDSSLDTLLPGWREGPDASAISRAFEAGHAMSSDEAMAYALSEASG